MGKHRKTVRVLLGAAWLALAPSLGGQQVDDQLAYAYLAEPAYPYDIQLGELFVPYQQTGSAVELYRLSKNFWRNVLQEHNLGESIAPLSLQLLQLQFEDYLRKGARPAGLAAVRTAQPVISSESARVESKLIFDDKTYILATLYFLANENSAKKTDASASKWLIEAADFRPGERWSLPGGYNYEPRSDQFLRGVGR